LRVPMLTWGNCVLAEVLAPCGVSCDGASRLVAVAEAMLDVYVVSGDVL
jgi:hypothetical protein